MKPDKPTCPGSKSVTVLGAGGNIGSHLVPHLCRLPNVGRITLVDRDVYEPKNLSSQDITPRDIGQPKVEVQARRLHRINPTLDVVAIHESLENVPLGALCADVMLGCLDSRAARQAANQAAWRVGSPYIDGGVSADELLVRVSVFVPGPESACLECGWNDQDYQLMEQAHPCQGGGPQTVATNAPSGLGALAASLQAIECQKLLAATDRHKLVAQMVMTASARQFYTARLGQNRLCRFNHRIWQIARLKKSARELTLGDALNLVPSACALRLDGQPFVIQLVCGGCGHKQEAWRVRGRLPSRAQTCRRCGGEMLAAGSDMVDWLEATGISDKVRSRPLASLGLRGGDVFTVRASATDHHFEIGGDHL